MNNGNLGDAGADGFFNQILDIRFGNKGDKFFGISFNYGQKSGAATSSSNDGFGDCHSKLW